MLSISCLIILTKSSHTGAKSGKLAQLALIRWVVFSKAQIKKQNFDEDLDDEDLNHDKFNPTTLNRRKKKDQETMKDYELIFYEVPNEKNPKGYFCNSRNQKV